MFNRVDFGKISMLAVAVVIVGVALFVIAPQTIDFKAALGMGVVEAQCCGGSGGDNGEPDPERPDRPTPTLQAPRCDSFTVSPKTLPNGGGNVELTWHTSGTGRTVSINNGVGRVTPDNTKTVNVTKTTTFTLTVSNTGGSDTCVVKVTVNPPVAKPAVCDSFTASRSTVPSGGANVALTWATTNASSVSINNGVGTVSADGSKTVNVAKTTTFTLTAVGAGGNDTCAVKVTVNPPVAKPAVCDSFTASRSTVPSGGANVTLTWATTNASAVVINNGVGTVAADGSTTRFVDNTTTFTLTAKSADGNDTCTVTITERPPVQNAAVCDFLNTNKSSLPHGGGNVTLSWGTTNATSVSINNGVGNVADDGSKTVFVDDSTTFTLTAVGAAGNDSCTVQVDVDGAAPAPRCDFLTVSDDKVEEGDEVTLEWATTNADSVSINEGIGSVSNDGSRRVEVNDDTTFVLTARADGNEDTCSVRVEVEEEEEEEEPRPTCDLEISDRNVKKGDEVTLEWETRNADEVTIEDDRGRTIFRDRSVSDRADGDVEVEITRDTEFTLIAEGDGGTRRCEVDVEIKEGETVVITETPRVAGISLTQVPYTGFEAGPTVTYLFYGLLTLWAFGIAYMLVIRKDTVFGFSLAGARQNEGTIYEDRLVHAPIAASVATIPANLPTAETMIGYDSLYETAEEETEVESDTALTTLENVAHSRRVLLSSDALRFLGAHYPAEAGVETLNRLIDAAKSAFPSEDGWVVLNLARVEELLGGVEEETVSDAVVVDSLATAIVTGDIVSAYQLIERRPMVALALAAAELDAAYRARRGDANVEVAGTLIASLETHRTEEIKAAIDALTGALDGTYSDEQSAVKVAIMKAVNVFSA